MRAKLSVRDLINVGIFGVLYVVVLYATGSIGAINPLMSFVGWALGGLLNGIVIALFIARTPKIGALTLVGLMAGLSMAGHTPANILIGPVCGLVADLIVTSGGKSTKPRRVQVVAGYVVFNLIIILQLIPIMLSGEAYYQLVVKMMGQHYADQLRYWFTVPILSGWAVVWILITICGGLLGVRVGAKHFRRAGLTN